MHWYFRAALTFIMYIMIAVMLIDGGNIIYENYKFRKEQRRKKEQTKRELAELYHRLSEHLLNLRAIEMRMCGKCGCYHKHPLC